MKHPVQWKWWGYTCLWPTWKCWHCAHIFEVLLNHIWINMSLFQNWEPPKIDGLSSLPLLNWLFWWCPHRPIQSHIFEAIGPLGRWASLLFSCRWAHSAMAWARALACHPSWCQHGWSKTTNFGWMSYNIGWKIVYNFSIRLWIDEAIPIRTILTTFLGCEQGIMGIDPLPSLRKTANNLSELLAESVLHDG